MWGYTNFCPSGGISSPFLQEIPWIVNMPFTRRGMFKEIMKHHPVYGRWLDLFMIFTAGCEVGLGRFGRICEEDLGMFRRKKRNWKCRCAAATAFTGVDAWVTSVLRSFLGICLISPANKVMVVVVVSVVGGGGIIYVSLYYFIDVRRFLMYDPSIIYLICLSV